MIGYFCTLSLYSFILHILTLLACSPRSRSTLLFSTFSESTKIRIKKIIFEDKYSEYQNALNKIDLESLAVRREDLCVNFARKNVNNAKLNQHFVENNKTHKMKTRNAEKYKVNHAQTERQ